MAELTQNDLNRIYDKLDPIALDVAIIKTNLEAHLKAHRRWTGPVIRFVFDFVKMGAVAVITWVFVRK